jgi:hypothetical protein
MRCEINYIVHATEDQNKIMSSLENTLGLKINTKKIRRSDVSGHFGNPIIYIKIVFKDPEANELLKTIISKLDSIDKLSLGRDLDDYFEKKKFFMRLDKQAMCLGKIKLSEKDSIRIMFSGVSKELIIKSLSGE